MRKICFFRLLAPLSFFVCLAFALAACSSYSAAHLKRNPWQVAPHQQLTSQTLNFIYTVEPSPEGGSLLKGSASPLPGGLPSWATWFEQGSIIVYVTDSTGRIAEEKLVEFLPQPVHEPLTFECSLDIPTSMDDRSYFVSFGYYIVPTDTKPAGQDSANQTVQPRKIIRHEGAYPE